MSKSIVTLIGSYRKDIVSLKVVFDQLSSHYNLISPKSVDFVDQTVEFVKLASEINDSVNVIEERVIDAIQRSDFVWLFAPNGYVGISAAFEIGFAHAIGVPIYTDNVLVDEMLNSMVTGVLNSPAKVPVVIHQPGKAISGLQKYYQKVSSRRGWDKETSKDIMLLMIEEMGELARAIRKSQGLKRHKSYDDANLSDELADVQLYLIHLANSLNVKLDEAVTQKEIKNAERFKKSK